jgi:hypothetical protein
MELVNSKEKLLKGPEIVAMSAYNMPDLKYPKEVVLAAVAMEFTLPRTDLVQIGNTVFVAHMGKGKSKKKMQQFEGADGDWGQIDLDTQVCVGV